jgi:DNA-binding CsgD family transcriptional regulator
LKIGGKALPAYGTATLILTVRHPWAGRELGIKLGRINSAFELYAGGQLVAHAGSLPRPGKDFRAELRPQVARFTPDSGETVFTLLVANQDSPSWGGPVDGLQLGTAAAMERSAQGMVAIDSVNIGGRIVIILFLLGACVALRQPWPLLAAAWQLAMVVRLLAVREILFLRLSETFDGITFHRVFSLATLAVGVFMLLTAFAFLRRGTVADPGGPARQRRGFRAWLGSLGVAERVALGLALAALPLAAALMGRDMAVILAAYRMLSVYSLLAFAWPFALIAARARQGRAEWAFGWFFAFYVFYAIVELLHQVRLLKNLDWQPLFFAGGPSLPQSIVAYLSVVCLGIFLVYRALSALLHQRLAAMGATRVPPAEPGPAAKAGAVPSVSAVEAPNQETPAALATRFGLSLREADILVQAARGRTYAEIADACGISLNTVKTHLGNVYQKIGVKNKAELAHRISRKS